MREKYWIPGFALGGVGAVLAFALEDDDETLLFIRLRPFGLILLVAGALFLAWGVVQWRQSNQPRRGRAGSRGVVSTQAESIRSVGGLIAVAIGVGAVAALTIVTLTAAADLDDASTVAVATSAFGVISTVVGAFMGIKIGTDQSGQAVEETKTAVATATAATAKLSDQQKKDVQKEVSDAATITRAPTSRGGS